MDLRHQKQTILDNILKLIENGTTIRDKIDTEYRTKRNTASFAPEKDIPIWSRLFQDWHEDCIAQINECFHPAVIITNRFKNPKMDGLYLSGENMEWNSLIKNLNARLDLLDTLYEAIATIKEEELADFIEFNVNILGLKIKVDKIISRLAKA